MIAIKEIKKFIKNSSFRKKANFFIVEGKKAVLEVFYNFKENFLHCFATEPISNIPTQIVDANFIKKISSLQNVNCIAIFKKFNLINSIHFFENKKTLIFPLIQNPDNLGAIIRSAVAFKVNNFLLSNKSCYIFNPKTIRATAGFLNKINIGYFSEDDIYDFLEKNNKKVLMLDINGKNIKTLNLKTFDYFLIGAERGFLKNFDFLQKAKIDTEIESLNVTVATSILLYEVYNS